MTGKPPREFELKLTVPDGAVGTLTDCAALQPARPVQRRHQVTTYFDTPDHALARRGLSLRVRSSGNKKIQTLKADRNDGVAADRAEWEWPVQQDTPDLSLLAQTKVARELPDRLELEPVSTSNIDRTTRLLELDGGAIVEAALDEGTIVAGDAHEAVRELELELRKGDPAAVYRLALELHGKAPLTVENESKGARGYRLNTGEVPAPHKAPAVRLKKTASAAKAFRHILTAQLSHLLVNRPAALSGDAEGVHQMRVAVRRLRAALAMFKPFLEPQATARFEMELRRVGQVFGEARDWDVFCLQILPKALHGTDTVGWRDLLSGPATARRGAAHQRFAEEVRGPAFTALVLALAAWAEQARDGSRLLGGPALERSIEDVSPHLLNRLARKVERRGHHIDRSDADRHALRKSLKKLRYAIDYIEAVYPRKSCKSYVHACKKLQATLGDINDAVMAFGLADRLADGTRPDLVPAVGALAVQLDRRREAGLHDLARRWKAFRGKQRFWA